MATNTFELSAQMILFADAKGRGAAKLITPAYNIMQKLSQHKKLKARKEAAEAKDIALTQQQQGTIKAVIKPENIGDNDENKVKISGKISEVDVILLSNQTLYIDGVEQAKITALETLTDNFIDIQSDLNVASKDFSRVKEEISKGFENLKGDINKLIAKGKGADKDNDIEAALKIAKFYKNDPSADPKETGVLVTLRECKKPDDIDNAADTKLVAFNNAYAKTIDSNQNGEIDFNLFTAKKTEGENVIKTDTPIKVKKRSLKKAFKFKDDSFADNAIPGETDVEFEWDLDKKDIKFDVKARFGDSFVLNKKKDIFYLNQGTILFIRNAD